MINQVNSPLLFDNCIHCKTHFCIECVRELFERNQELEKEVVLVHSDNEDLRDEVYDLEDMLHAYDNNAD